jgi:hypothetical protein
MLWRLAAVQHGGGGALVMLGPGERVHEVEHDKVKAVLYAAVAMVGSRDENGSGGRSSSSAMEAAMASVCSCSSALAMGGSKASVSD